MNVRDVLPRDAIPSIDEPTFGDEFVGGSDDEVVVLDLGGEPPRAYPIRILSYHEIVNDVVDGLAGDEARHVAVTWCPLCGSAVVYDRTVGGRVLTFGVSGKLADDDLVMYDRETGSEWKQSLGECIAGPLDGEALEVLPAAMTTWERFVDDHPDGVVLQPTRMRSEAASDDDTPAPVDYSMKPYRRYFDSEGFGLAAHRGTDGERTWSRDDLGPKDVVLGLVRDGEAVGYPLSRVIEAGGVVHDRIGGRETVVFATEGGIHAFESHGFEFEPVGGARFTADGTVWDGVTGRSEDGRRLERTSARRLFAFAWQDDHGADAFYAP